MPPDETAARIFNALGGAIEVSDVESFDGYGAASALMATYFGLLERISGWMVAEGLPAHKARESLVPLFHSLARVAAATPQASFAELREGHSTRGGLNEQVFADFEAEGGSQALLDALDRVFRRARA